MVLFATSLIIAAPSALGDRSDAVALLFDVIESFMFLDGVVLAFNNTAAKVIYCDTILHMRILCNQAVMEIQIIFDKYFGCWHFN